MKDRNKLIDCAEINRQCRPHPALEVLRLDQMVYPPDAPIKNPSPLSVLIGVYL